MPSHPPIAVSVRAWRCGDYNIAFQVILPRPCGFLIVAEPLPPAALGRVLAEDVGSDVELPPFEKALMDGYALHSTDPGGWKLVLSVVEEFTAGWAPATGDQAGSAQPEHYRGADP
jgi:hypothetical protein